MTSDHIYIQRSSEFESRLDGGYRGKTDADTSGSIAEYDSDSDFEQEANSDPQFEIKYEFETLDQLFPDRVPDPILDLIELSVATMGVDRFIKRTVVAGEDVPDADARLNTRSLVVRFPVLSPTFAIADVEDLVSTLVSHMTRDIIEFELLAHPSSEVTTTQETLVEPEPIDVVSLFSDGLDSAGGVYQNRTDDVISRYVSLRYGSGLGNVHKTAISELDIDPIEIGIEYSGKSNEFTNFSRGFLHWAFAAAVAVAVEAEEVRSFETGVMARFALLSEAWQTTRTVSPIAVGLFNELIAEATDYDIQVTNPFLEKTKTEVVNQIENETVVGNAVSCPHYGHQRQFDLHNCGQCVPCIVRNIAILDSKHIMSPAELSICDWIDVDFDAKVLPEKQPVILEGRNDADTFFLALNEIAYLSRSLRQRDPVDVVTEYPKLASPEVYGLYRRFANEFHHCIDSLVSENSTAATLFEL